MRVERVCSIVDVPVLVRVRHGHLDPAYRVEDSAESRERFSITITVAWADAGGIDFSRLYNYALLYRLLQSRHDTIVTGPIETFLDAIEAELLASAAAADIRLTRSHLVLVRPDLLHGHVRLEKITTYPAG